MKNAQPRNLRVYVGTYTAGRSRGVYCGTLEAATGKLGELRLAAELEDPTYLAFDPRERCVYAVSTAESPGTKPVGLVTAFAADRETGELKLLNQQATPGTNPCHLAVEPGGRFVLTANYGDGSVSVFPLRPDGCLAPVCEHVQHHGSGPRPDRQAGPHAHAVNLDPSGRWVLVADLGIDRVLVYRFDATCGKLTLHDQGTAPVPAGAGPRHLAFDRAGRCVYLITELSNELIVFSFDAASGKLCPRQTLSTLPPGFGGESWGAEVMVHPSGRYVYASNRGADSLAIYTVTQETGRLALVGHVPTGGRTPRSFALDPQGRFLLVANQQSDHVASFRVDDATGQLTPTGSVQTVPAPTCVTICGGE